MVQSMLQILFIFPFLKLNNGLNPLKVRKEKEEGKLLILKWKQRYVNGSRLSLGMGPI